MLLTGDIDWRKPEAPLEEQRTCWHYLQHLLAHLQPPTNQGSGSPLCKVLACSQTSAKMISFWGAHSSESLLCWFEDFTVFSSPSLDQGASWEIPVKMHVLRQLHIPVINLGGKLTNNYTSLMHLSLCSSKVVSELKSRSKAPADSFIHLNNPPRFLGPCGLENNLLTSSAAGGLSSFSGTCLKAVRQIPFLNKKQNSP